MASPRDAIEIGAPKTQQDSLLLLLPTELRAMIFELALQDAGDEESPTDSVYLTRYKENASWRQNFAFLLTCRSIYHEACGTFYNTHKIGLLGIYAGEVARFVGEHTALRLAGIRRLEVIINTAEDTTTTMRLMNQLPRVYSLKFVVYQDDRMGTQWQRRSLRWDRGRSAALFLRRMQMELKSLQRAMKRVKSLASLELDMDQDDWDLTEAEADQIRSFERFLNWSLSEARVE